MSSDKQDDEPSSGARAHREAFSGVERKWLAKQIGRHIEVYSTRTPKVEGLLTHVDERFGRMVIQTENEEVLCWLGYTAQIRLSTENNGKARERQK